MGTPVPVRAADALACLGLVTRYQLVPGVHLRTPAVAFWLVALGWAAAKATNARQRVALTVVVVATVPGFFGELQREAVVIAGLAVLVWLPTVPSLPVLNRVAGVLAGSSLYIYLSHWKVFPLLPWSPLLAVVASLAAGVAYQVVATRTMKALGAAVRARRRRGGRRRRGARRPRVSLA